MNYLYIQDATGRRNRRSSPAAVARQAVVFGSATAETVDQFLEIGGRIRLDENVAAAERVLESERSRVQSLAMKSGLTRPIVLRSVNLVADHGMPDRRQMNANLMSSTRFEAARKQTRDITKTIKHAIMRHRVFSLVFAPSHASA